MTDYPAIYRPNENVTLYRGDCLHILPTLADVDAVISDPPYGMAEDTNRLRFSGGEAGKNRGKNWGEPIANDDAPFDPAPWLAFPAVVLFGMNHFAARLPVGTTLVWLKRFEPAYGTFLSDAELAWMKGGCGVYARREIQTLDGMGERKHPTQKPVAIMEWCMERAKVEQGALVLDPYMGSGTTGIACIRTGRRFIGVEIDPAHYATADSDGKVSPPRGADRPSLPRDWHR